MSLNKLDKVMRETEVKSMTHAFDFPRRTHVETLTDGTPKSRRRIRATLNIARGCSVDHEDAKIATGRAVFNERREAMKVASERKQPSSQS